MKEDNLTVEGYEFIRDSYVEGAIMVKNVESGGYECWFESPHAACFTLHKDGIDYEFSHSVSYTVAHNSCDGCSVMRINGMVCHESGCPRQGED